MNNIFTVRDFSGKIIRDSNVYRVTDNKILKNLVVSKTELYVGQQTQGHSHDQEEVYQFISGVGIIELGEQRHSVSSGSIVTIPSGVFHRVYNSGNEDLIFVCVFQEYTR